MTMTTTAMQTAITAIVLSATLPEKNTVTDLLFSLSEMLNIIEICRLINSILSHRIQR